MGSEYLDFLGSVINYINVAMILLGVTTFSFFLYEFVRDRFNPRLGRIYLLAIIFSIFFISSLFMERAHDKEARFLFKNMIERNDKLEIYVSGKCCTKSIKDLLLSVHNPPLGNRNKSNRRDKIDISIKLNNGRSVDLVVYRSTHLKNNWEVYTKVNMSTLKKSKYLGIIKDKYGELN
ncbi:hypothetical protein CW749_03145 [Vibrio sp. vnigr-6D03]|uniref:hypothetical protein n=1 Tax=Vibrio sp. vnigr-6D03 TaxID=2058088 RepID=UPI000C323D9B|nr:hypothetical protein [Vibrio sp. vnigr-6D03]PKF81647.1 hypothetical protein CW749_03145 [Vibrio sp. vnigr-6D03]